MHVAIQFVKRAASGRSNSTVSVDFFSGQPNICSCFLAVSEDVDAVAAVLYLNKAKPRDKICRAIQYGSKFMSNGVPDTAQNIDKSASVARNFFVFLSLRKGMSAIYLMFT